MVGLVAAQGGGALVRRLVEVAGSGEAPADLCEAALYDCAVVVFNLAGAAASCPAMQRDLVGEGGVLPALATLAGVRYRLAWGIGRKDGWSCAERLRASDEAAERVSIDFVEAYRTRRNKHLPMLVSVV